MRTRPLGNARVGEAKDPPLRALAWCDEVCAALEERLDLSPAPDTWLDPGPLRLDERPWPRPRRIQAGCLHEDQILLKLLDRACSLPCHAFQTPPGWSGSDSAALEEPDGTSGGAERWRLRTQTTNLCVNGWVRSLQFAERNLHLPFRTRVPLSETRSLRYAGDATLRGHGHARLTLGHQDGCRGDVRSCSKALHACRHCGSAGRCR